MKRIVLLMMGLCLAATGFGRDVVCLSDGWTVHPAYDVNETSEKQAVCIPHTWGAKDVLGGVKKERAAYTYECLLPVGKEDGRRVFVRFGAVNNVADVSVNGHYVGAHFGGYTAFCFEITDFLQVGDNVLTVVCSNVYRTDVAPLGDGFDAYGGITRPVQLIITGADCISPLDYASSGVYVHQDSVSADSASVSVETVVSAAAGVEVRASILDADGQAVASVQSPVSEERVRQPLGISAPHLWKGRKQPYLYKVKVELLRDGEVVDSVEERLGLRTFRVDPAEGFFLNGEQLDLHGVCRSEEPSGQGGAYDEAAMRRDAQLIAQMGATAVRFLHFPHSEYDVWQYDSLGIVVWNQLNFGGCHPLGYVKNPQLEAHLMQNLEEMIRQNYNSPSVCFWSLCNELSFKQDEPAAFLKQLNDRAKQLDSQRLTTMAICYGQRSFLHITDVVGWNKCCTLHDTGKEAIGPFLDEVHALAGIQPVGLCEYGAPGSIRQHGFLQKAAGAVCTEEYQAKQHEGNWELLAARPYVWCKFIRQFADSPMADCDEGNDAGLNEGGVATSDRSICKDAYYFYQANWTKAPMLHIAARRYTERTDSVADIKVYTNQPKATLYVNGVRIGVLKNDGKGRIIYPRIKLRRGENTIEVNAGKNLGDRCNWTVKGQTEVPERNEKDANSIDGAIE